MVMITGRGRIRISRVEISRVRVRVGVIIRVTKNDIVSEFLMVS